MFGKHNQTKFLICIDVIYEYLRYSGKSFLVFFFQHIRMSQP